MPPCLPRRKSRNGRHWDSKFGRLSHKSIANTKKVLWSFRKRIEKIRKLSKISIQQYPKIWPKLPHWTIYFWKNNKKSTFCKISEFSRRTPKTNKNIFRNNNSWGITYRDRDSWLTKSKDPNLFSKCKTKMANFWSKTEKLNKKIVA